MSVRVSIIVPVHNTKAFLEECLESLMFSPEDEIILIDDASDDGSELICAAWAAKYPVAVRLFKTHGVGVSEARNLGIRAAQGRYITFVDSDDRLIASNFEHLVEKLDEEPECGIAIGQFTQVDKNNHRGGEWSYFDAKSAISYTLYQNPLFHTSAWGKLYRREIFKSDIEWFRAGRRYEDLEIFPRLYIKAKKIAVSTECVYFYRFNPNSFINQWTPDRCDTLWATQEIIKFISERLPELKRAAISRYFSANFNVFQLASKGGNTELQLMCWTKICKYRSSILSDPQVRAKNKFGAILSYGGRFISRFVTKHI